MINMRWPSSQLSIWGSHEKSRESRTRKDTRVQRAGETKDLRPSRGVAARSRVL